MAGAGVAVQAVDVPRGAAPRSPARRGRRPRGTARSSPARSGDRARVISIGSLKFCSVNAAECRNPCSALAIHFARPCVRQVALDAGRGVPVAALQPGVVLLVHDVAVHAGARVGREVREALGVDEGERADSDRDADEDGEQEESRNRRHRALSRQGRPGKPGSAGRVRPSRSEGVLDGRIDEITVPSRTGSIDEAGVVDRRSPRARHAVDRARGRDLLDALPAVPPGTRLRGE